MLLHPLSFSLSLLKRFSCSFHFIIQIQSNKMTFFPLFLFDCLSETGDLLSSYFRSHFLSFLFGFKLETLFIQVWSCFFFLHTCNICCLTMIRSILAPSLHLSISFSTDTTHPYDYWLLDQSIFHFVSLSILCGSQNNFPFFFFFKMRIFNWIHR